MPATRWLLAAALGLAAAGPARPDTLALLVGVSRYDEGVGLASLRGPANDVRLLRDTLAARGVTSITVLADGVEGTPTRGAILDAFADLGARSGPGDLVYIHLSGHGTRQPDADGDEADGLDEVFLPADAGPAPPGSTAIRNAITDDEIGAAVMAIRDGGADVWFAMDSCNSGSGLRAGSLDVASRWVDPAVLGVPRSSPGAAAAATGLESGAGDGIDAGGGTSTAGGLVAFYAARSSEVAVEVNLTPGSAGDEGWYGLFSARLAARLAGAEALSYRQLFQGVLSDMNDSAAPGGARLQTPSWEGDLIDAVALGGGGTVGLRQFAVTGDEVAAGLVHGIRDGTLMALVADAADPPGAVIGHAQVEDAEATLAYLRPVDARCEPRAEAPCPTLGTLPEGARFARVVARPLDLALRLAPAHDLRTGEAVAEGDPAAVALRAAIAEVNGAAEVRVLVDPVGFSVDVAAHEGRLWFGTATVVGETPVGLSWAPTDGVPLATLLARIAHAEELAALLGSLADAGSVLDPNPIALTAEVLVSRPADLDPPGAPTNPARECRRAIADAAADPLSPLADAADLKQCDLLSLSARGTSPGVRDVNRVHIDARFCVHVAHAQIEDGVAAAPIGSDMVMCSDCPDGYSAGHERLFVIVTESRDNAEPLNLEGLVETCEGGPATRGAAADPAAARAADILERLGRRPDTRGSFGGLDIADVWVTAYRWRVLPRDVVFQGRAPEAAREGADALSWGHLDRAGTSPRVGLVRSSPHAASERRCCETSWNDPSWT